MAGLLGTTTSDQDFYQRKLAGAADWINQFAAQRQRQKEIQDAREQKEIDFALKTIQEQPELAKTFGADIVKRYGQKYPMVASLVGAMQQPDLLQNQMQDTGDAWTNNWRSMMDQYKQRQAAVQSMPDTVSPSPVAAGPGGVPFAPNISLPNPDKERALGELRRTRPELFSLQAMQALDPKQQAAARLFAKSRNIPIPEAFDPHKQLPGDEVALYAAQAGELDPNDPVVQAQRYKAGLEQDPARLQEQGYQRQERVAREGYGQKQLQQRIAAETEHANQADKLARSRAVFQDSLIRNRAEQGFERSKQLIDYRGKSSSTNAWGSIMKATKDTIADYDQRLREAAQGKNGRQRDEAIKAFQAQNGQRPTLITGLTAKRLKDAIEQASGGDQDIFDKMMSQAVVSMQQGESEESALADAKDLYGAWPGDLQDEGTEAANSLPVQDRTIGIAGPGERVSVSKPAAQATSPIDPNQVRAQIKARMPKASDQEIDRLTQEFMKQHGNG